MRLLRLFLGFSAVAWGVSLAGVFLPWSTAVEALRGLGGPRIPHDPMLDYWLRMASGAFALVGGIFVLLMLRPLHFRAVIPWFGVLMLLEGLILMVHGIRLRLPPFPFLADTLACLVGGAGILGCSARALRGGPAEEAGPGFPDRLRGGRVPS